ncbi:MAG: hypothetical protein LBU32_20865 [Clostridiales bacterium]|nr:hypothetical protein [Clostridiales bacterium]
MDGAAEARIKGAESREDKLKAAWKADSAAAASLDLEVAATQEKVEFRYEALSKTGSAPEAGEGDQGAALKKRRAEDDLQNAGIELKGAKEGRKATKAAAGESKRASGSARKSLAALGREAKEAENSFIKAETAAKVGFIESAAEKMPAVEGAAFVPAGSWRASKRTVDALSKINCIYIGNMKANRKIGSGSSGAKGKRIMAGVKRFAKSVKLEGACKISAGGGACICCRYEGSLNGMKNAAAAAAWAEGGLQGQAPKASARADASIESKGILGICGWRRQIEALFQRVKAVGFDSRQAGGMQTIANCWSLSGIFRAACRIGLCAQVKFSGGLEMMRAQSLGECAENTVNGARRGSMEDEGIIKLYAA